MNSFSELQRFRIRWAWAAVIVFNLVFLYAIGQQIIFKIPFGAKPAPDYVLVLIELLPLSLLIFLFSIKLYTHYSKEGITFRFAPFHLRSRKIEWHELASISFRNYNALYEFGGWGIRSGNKQTGKAYISSSASTIGLQLQFKNGNLLLISTQYPTELKARIENWTTEGIINKSF